MFEHLPITRADDGSYRTVDGGTFRVDETHRSTAERVADMTGGDDAVHPDGAGLHEADPERDEQLHDIDIDPVTRVAGSLAFHANVDLEERTVREAHAQATLFRGYEIILEGRDPRDAIDLSSRACGVCGAVHSICSSMALEMALPVEPPPMGVWARNMGQAAAFLYDNSLHLHLLAGPDYSAAMMADTNPDLLATARETAAPHADIHGYETVGEIMEGLNPLEGDLYLSALEKTRDARQMASLMLGKYPHPSTIAPGGVTTTLSRSSFTQFYTRLDDMFDWAKQVAYLWDDLMDFMLEEQAGFEHVGEHPKNMIGTGVYDDPDVYNARYEDADEWGNARLATPGVVVDGELVTTNLTEIDIGMEEFVDHAYYEDWTDEAVPFETSPAGDPLSPYHPWNKETRPKPDGKSWRERYTWGTAPRWDRHTMECCPHARLWITALAEEVDNPFIRPTGDGIEFDLPEADLEAMTLRWDVPDRLNAAERLRGKAYALAHHALVCYTGFIESLELLKGGEDAVHTEFSIPKRGTHRGVGFWEAGRGFLTHHLTLEDGLIDNYQIVTPSTWNSSPTGPFGQSGPFEVGAMNTPILEDFDGEDDFSAIDILRGVRSFDPCMPCTVHMYTAGGNDVISENVTMTTCGCSTGSDDKPAEVTLREMLADD
ncbi:nickel-dependent hydrogenase large subunit [Haloplanus natans]|uniref:nickel-dependent hydrogenase large subunit n=1 Tax=Haloplanus natans TaxID=376171 RepID=UPI001B7F9DF9|nr:nickel-dependent hydrogenase large subunit [Haloplanus natans]